MSPFDPDEVAQRKVVEARCFTCRAKMYVEIPLGWQTSAALFCPICGKNNCMWLEVALPEDPPPGILS